MMPSPDRTFARILICVLAAVGFLLTLGVLLLRYSGSVSFSGVRTQWCVVAPVSFFDWAVHSTAFGTWLLLLIPILIALRTANRERAFGAQLGAAMRAARLASVPDRVLSAAEAVGVTDSLDVVDAVRPFAFVYGWISPRICVSTGMVDRLTDRELEAVLRHERWHVVRRDPIRLLMVRTIAAAFAFFPTIRRLARHHRLATEISADRHAVTEMGSHRWLASALAKVVEIESSPRMVAFLGMADARIAALAGELPADRGQLHRVAMLVLLGELAIVGILLMRSGASPSLAFWPYPIC